MTVRVICESSPATKEFMISMAETLGLELLPAGRIQPNGEFTHVLFSHQGRLSLRQNTISAPSATSIDFTDAALQYRQRTSGKQQGIGRAVGLKKLENPFVVDATAGMGRDAFILASMGCRVLMLERSPVIHALLDDGLRRANESENLAGVLDNMELLPMDAIQWCRQAQAVRGLVPDVLYLDPMFPVREKSAKVKKDIGLMQALLGPDEDFPTLLDLARQTATRRVVVKQPGKRSRDMNPAPDFQVPGNSCHFDIFLCKAS